MKSFFKKLWAKVTGIRGWWLILPVVLLGLWWILRSTGRGLVGLPRVLPRGAGSPSPPVVTDGPSLSPKEAHANIVATEKKAKKKHKVIREKWKEKRKAWIKKFKVNAPRAILWFLISSLAAGCGAGRKNGDPDIMTQPTGPADNPVDLLGENCKPATDGRILVECNPQAFMKAGLDMMTVIEALEHCEVNLDKINTIGIINVMEIRGHYQRCKTKLDSPWRSPWLWGIVGAAVGAAAAAVLSAN